jgi:ATP-binding cassette subfamily B protein
MGGYALAEANYISTLQGIEAVKSHNKEELFAVDNKSIYENFQGMVFRLGKIQIKLSLLANGFGAAFLTTILLSASYQELANQLKPGELIAVISLCGSLLPAIGNLALVSIPLSEAKIAFDRMFEFTGVEPEKVSGKAVLTGFNRLRCDEVAFRFAGRRQTLRNISFEVSRGETIAIMGENGCGKSTLTQLLQKHYEPESGRITINGELPLQKVPLGDWRNMVGIVPQNIHIFNGTVLENIAFEDARENQQQALSFLKEYALMPFFELLPQSYSTLVGEEGINLSGGQRQMIALARALYHRPQLLILDEATAAMDRRSEQFVLNLLMELKKEMGIIFITHRLHVLKNFCDRIYVLENGIITQSGSHQQLLQSQNLYSDYWTDLVS